MRLGLGLGLTQRGSAGAGIATLPMSGLTSGEARIGDHGSISVAFPVGVTAWTSQAWGISVFGDTTYGTGANPSDYTASDGATLVWEGVGDDGNTYRASAPIRRAVAVNSITPAPGGGLIVDYTGTLTVSTASGGGVILEVA